MIRLAAPLLVVRLRGTINVPRPVRETLRRLRLERINSAVLLADNPVHRGMLRYAKDYVSWSPVSVELIEKLLESRGRKSSRSIIHKPDLKHMGYSSFRGLAKALAEGKVEFSSLQGLKPFFTLSPPRKGFKKSTKKMHSDGGVLGENPELPRLVEAMI